MTDHGEQLAERVREAFGRRGVQFEEKRMMGGICFLVDDKMCVGVDNDGLLARIGPDAYDKALQRKGCGPMDFTRRPMKGFVSVRPEGLTGARNLGRWIDLALEFNPLAKSSKKAKKKKSTKPA